MQKINHKKEKKRGYPVVRDTLPFVLSRDVLVLAYNDFCDI